MRVKSVMCDIADYIRRITDKISDEQVEQVVSILTDAASKSSKVLVTGAGRSGLVARAFAMRLMHLGFNVYVVGETITPALEKNDLLIAISGSGTTRLVVTAAQIAKEVGASIVAITSHAESPLGRLADYLMIIPGRSKVAKEEDYNARQMLGEHEPLAPLGTLFEVTTMIFLDGVITELMYRLGRTEKDMLSRHAVIE